MTEYYRYLDIPHPPESMIAHARKSIYKNLNKINIVNEGHSAETVTINNTTVHYGQYLCDCPMPEEDREWFNTNVIDASQYPITAHFTIKGDLYPHIDQYRIWGLNYVFETGGPGVETYWAQEDGQPLHRPQVTLNHFRYSTNLNELDSFIARPNTWWLIRTDIIHGTRGQTKDRGSITVGISQTQYETLISKFKTVD